MFKANIQYLDPLCAPDDYSLIGTGTPPPSDFVVSRRRNGQVCSTYGDDTWILDPYDELETCRLHFTNWCTESPSTRERELVGQLRYTSFLQMWKRSGEPLSLGVIDSRNGAMANVCAFCNTKQTSLFSFYGNLDLIRDFVRLASYSVFQRVQDTLYTLARISRDERGFDIITITEIEELNEVAATCSGWRQHPPIPTRIFSAIIAALESHFDEVEPHLDAISTLIVTCAETKESGNKVTKSVFLELTKNVGLCRWATCSVPPHLCSKRGAVKT